MSGNILSTTGKVNESATQQAYANVIQTLMNQIQVRNASTQAIFDAINKNRERADKLNQAKAQTNLAIQAEANKDKLLDFYGYLETKQKELNNATPEQKAKIIQEASAFADGRAQERAVRMGYDTSKHKATEEKLLEVGMGAIAKGGQKLYEKGKEIYNKATTPPTTSALAGGEAEQPSAMGANTAEQPSIVAQNQGLSQAVSESLGNGNDNASSIGSHTDNMISKSTEFARNLDDKHNPANVLNKGNSISNSPPHLNF